MAGNDGLLFALSDQAASVVDWHAGTHWSLQHRQSGGDRWVEVGRFPAKKLANVTLDALVAHGNGTEKDFRIRKVTIPPRA